MTTHKTAADLKVGDMVITDAGTPVKIMSIKEGDHSPFGRFVKFRSSHPLTIYFKHEGALTFAVVGDDDQIEIATAKQEG